MLGFLMNFQVFLDSPKRAVWGGFEEGDEERKKHEYRTLFVVRIVMIWGLDGGKKRSKRNFRQEVANNYLCP